MERGGYGQKVRLRLRDGVESIRGDQTPSFRRDFFWKLPPVSGLVFRDIFLLVALISLHSSSGNERGNKQVLYSHSVLHYVRLVLPLNLSLQENVAVTPFHLMISRFRLSLCTLLISTLSFRSCINHYSTINLIVIYIFKILGLLPLCGASSRMPPDGATIRGFYGLVGVQTKAPRVKILKVISFG